jgi:hypothetical protein
MGSTGWEPATSREAEAKAMFAKDKGSSDQSPGDCHGGRGGEERWEWGGRHYLLALSVSLFVLDSCDS